MLCDLCKKRVANIHFTEIVNGQVNEIHLCETCAQGKGIGEVSLEPSFSFADIFAGLLDTEVPFGIPQDVTLECKNCGLTYANFRKGGRLGCSECYETFKENLVPLLRKIHGSVQHIGKAPLKEKPKPKFTSKIRELRNELNKVVLKEEFEKAAEIRDRIKELEKKSKG